MTIVLPAYNEEGNIADVVTQWLAVAGRVDEGRVLVVDDGSRDGTNRILNGLVNQYPALSVVRQQNGGHGAAIRLGYRLALEQGTGWIFQTDCDGQTSPGDFDAFWQRRAEAPFQIGIRRSRRDPWLRIVLSRWHVWLVDLLFHAPVEDPNVPFRLMRADLVRRYLELIPVGTFAPNVLMSVLACRQGILRTLPISHSPRAAGESSVKGWQIVKMAIRSIREYLSFRQVVRRAIL
ncbi:glycosyltransferase family 2 protein [uncultured Paludibaculum sp.]|uniref:glycosyltransferase family 2 protein n=1 Tax=uncultured Paludibaculum sp. TaxID=1765020 RepID=UPI002AABB422|nr:glycosyltransferase family 2 protein [uncultured Paludibaculum sp.]